MNWERAIGGLLTGIGQGLVEQANIAKQMALEELRAAREMAMRREEFAFRADEAQKDRDFRADEAEKARQFQAKNRSGTPSNASRIELARAIAEVEVETYARKREVDAKYAAPANAIDPAAEQKTFDEFYAKSYEGLIRSNVDPADAQRLAMEAATAFMADRAWQRTPPPAAATPPALPAPKVEAPRVAPPPALASPLSPNATAPTIPSPTTSPMLRMGTRPEDEEERPYATPMTGIR